MTEITKNPAGRGSDIIELYRLQGPADHHDCEYVRARTALVEVAVFNVSKLRKAVGKRPSPSAGQESLDWNQEFHAEMERLVDLHGLRRPES